MTTRSWAREFRFTFAGTSTLVQGSTDGDAAPEFEVRLAARVVLGGILAARLVSRPVKLVLKRDQMHGLVGHRAPTRQPSAWAQTRAAR